MNDDKKYEGLMTAVKDIMMKNQNLYQQDQLSQFNQYNQKTPEEVLAQTIENQVDVPDPYTPAETVDAETIIPSSGEVTDD
jgi:hypothetical protein